MTTLAIYESSAVLQLSKIWQCVTDLEVKKQGLAIYLALEGPARQACSNIDVKELHSENGIKIIIEKLKSLCAKDVSQSSSFHGIPYENFENFTRPEGMSVLNYINKFDQLYEVIKKYKMDGVLAYRLLKCANISKEKQQLARASLIELTFANMRKQLKAIHDSASDHYDIQAELPIKVEPAYEATDFKHESEVLFNRSGRQQRGNYRGRAKSYDNNRNNQSRNQSFGNTGGARNWSGNNSRQINRKNPVDSSGSPSRCAICESVYHWARDCLAKGKDPGNVEITLFCKEHEECYLESFLGESFINSPMLDSGWMLLNSMWRNLVQML